MQNISLYTRNIMRKIKENISLCVTWLSFLFCIISFFVEVKEDDKFFISRNTLFILLFILCVISVIWTILCNTRLKKYNHNKYYKILCTTISFVLIIAAIILIVFNFIGIPNFLIKTQPAPFVDGTISAEDFIYSHSDFIHSKIREYSESDIQTIQSASIHLQIFETAGYLYESEDANETPSQPLSGDRITSAQLFLLDYETLDVIHTYTINGGLYIEHYAEENDRFYCVIVAPGYNLYVSKPIAISEDSPDRSTDSHINFHLRKPDDKYGNPFLINLRLNDLNQSDETSFPRNYSVIYRCINTSSVFLNREDAQYYCGYMTVTDSHFLSLDGKESCQFSLNSRYELDISPDLISAKDTSSGYEISFVGFNELPYSTIYESPENSNIIHWTLEYNSNELQLRSFSPFPDEIQLYSE